MAKGKKPRNRLVTAFFMLMGGISTTSLVVSLVALPFVWPKLSRFLDEVQAVRLVPDAAYQMEAAFEKAIREDRIDSGQTLYMMLVPGITTLAKGLDTPPADKLPEGHPCLQSGLLGWVQLSTGVVITGLASRSEMYGPGSAANHLLCVDANGKSAPNSPGRDVFYGVFNYHADFEGAGEDTGLVFNWNIAYLPGTTEPIPFFETGWTVGAMMSKAQEAEDRKASGESNLFPFFKQQPVPGEEGS